MPSPRGRGTQPAPKKKRRQATQDNDGSSSEAEGEDNEVESEDDEAIVARLRELFCYFVTGFELGEANGRTGISFGFLAALEEMVSELKEEDLTPSEELERDTHVDRVAMLQQCTGQTKTTKIYLCAIKSSEVSGSLGKGEWLGKKLLEPLLEWSLFNSTSTLWRASEKIQRTSFAQHQAKCLSAQIAEFETLKRLGKELPLGELKKLKH